MARRSPRKLASRARKIYRTSSGLSTPLTPATGRQRRNGRPSRLYVPFSCLRSSSAKLSTRSHSIREHHHTQSRRVVLIIHRFIPPLTSSMMAPGLPDIAINYDIDNSTILALTLSIFVLALAIGVSTYLQAPIPASDDPLAPCYRPLVRALRPQMGPAYR